MSVTSLEGYSVLRNCAPADPLPVALARRIAKTKVGDPHMATLNRLFGYMTWQAQAQCKTELSRCRAAQRGESVAQIVETVSP